MKAQLFFNGKSVAKVPKGAKLISEKHEKHYGDAAYMEWQNKAASEYFAKQRQIREDMDAYHG